ncbi:carboxypeptidase regulatory-like domain-containing protein [Trichocoleus sp. FACHB-591]|uniref:carboxypeptidase regulatory-like domain-containing protein n=1 Tax=Trichocoleus sp. FACHB-591 TaxID=2692872 RepID=UPI0016838D67|nr:carboxypeptidase regulatory-like domain-containing protein [Trichocoleus sp. FACHB-591]MBD2094686.1 carboxypeptidase regulatory-like domain-containing protein [Trichocoleus sp. FACHB-591]
MSPFIPPPAPPAIVRTVPQNQADAVLPVTSFKASAETKTIQLPTPNAPETLAPESSETITNLLPKRNQRSQAQELGLPLSIDRDSSTAWTGSDVQLGRPENITTLSNVDIAEIDTLVDASNDIASNPSKAPNVEESEAIALPSLSSTSPEATPTPSLTPTPEATIPTSLSPIPQVPAGFTTFPVGINIERRNANAGVLVRGHEDGTQAIDFEQWLLPYDAVVQALKLSTKVLSDNQIELRLPTFAVRLNPTQLHNDPGLGLVFSVQELRSLFGLDVTFDINEYAIQLQAPWLDQPSANSPIQAAPVQLSGLAEIKAPKFSLAAIEQRLSASSTSSTGTNYVGDVTAVGTILGGSWFVRADQPELFSANSWRIAEARYQRQTNQADYILGTQPPFWLNFSANDYLGFTWIQRQGFTPPVDLYGENDPRHRLQAAQVGRTVSGKAEPGTLVRLVPGFSDRPIAETLVDSSGIYRFENIKLDNQALGGFYRVLLYPKGQLAAQPEIRNAVFSSVAGQLPAGASVSVASGGVRRNLTNSAETGLLSNFSNLTDFRGGVAQRWGVSNSLTVGAGMVYDQSLRGLGEIFFQPENFPLKVAVSALTGSGDTDWDINADISYDPSQNFSARLTSDRFSTRFNTYWRVAPGLALLGSTDSRDATAAGVQFNFSGKNSYTFGRITFDTKSHLRWNLLQHLGQLELSSAGNEVGSQSSLTYFLTRDSNFTTGQSLVLGYDTFHQDSNENLLSLAWHYRSKQRSVDNTPLWDIQLGYGMGSQGSGPIASVGTTIFPGMLLRARYQGVSVTSDESKFGLELVSGLNFQRGIRPSDRHADYLRTQGGLLIQPFFDLNNNAKQDAGEDFYTDPNLVILNNPELTQKSFERTDA